MKGHVVSFVQGCTASRGGAHYRASSNRVKGTFPQLHIKQKGEGRKGERGEIERGDAREVERGKK
jgi:hypothetical protein